MNSELDSLERDLRQELVLFCGWLSRLGFTPGTSGNLSVRLNPERILVTPTGMSKGLIQESDMVIVDLHGNRISGTRRVTSEIGMHLAVYRQRQDVGSVVHSHPPIATAFACAGRSLDQMLCQEAVMTIGAVPLAEYATTGTDQVPASLSPFLANHDVILLANHGAISYGGNIAEAFMKMETLEHVAHVALVAQQLGSQRPLSSEQIQDLSKAKDKYLHNSWQDRT